MQPTKPTESELVFGFHKCYNYLPPIEEIKENFNTSLKFKSIIMNWFHFGLKFIDGIPKEGIDKNKAFAHIKAILISFEPKHEHKIIGCAMLLENWFNEITYEKN